jgi:hypothetical protein
MSANRRPKVAVIVAATIPGQASAARLMGFAREVDGHGEVLLVDGSGDASNSRLADSLPGVRVARRPGAGLAPHLWREGFEATDSPIVVFTTAAMSPRPGWLDALIRPIVSHGVAASGGAIAPAPGLRRIGLATHALRYARATPPWTSDGPREPPGDNAAYRRDRLEPIASSFVDGFWEVEVHHALQTAGETWALVESAVVEHHGGTTLGAAAIQRFSHARVYGATRGCRMSAFERLARVAATPTVPLILAARVVRTLLDRGERPARWITAIPAVAVLLAAWSLGEAAGLAFGPRAQTGPKVRPLTFARPRNEEVQR